MKFLFTLVLSIISVNFVFSQSSGVSTIDSIQANILNILNRTEKINKKTEVNSISIWVYEKIVDETGDFTFLHPRKMDSIYFSGDSLFFHSAEFSEKITRQSGEKINRRYIEKTFYYSFFDYLNEDKERYKLELGNYIELRFTTDQLGLYYQLSYNLKTHKRIFLEKHYNEILDEFKVRWNSSKNKMVDNILSEDQRKYIVQANALTEEKKYYDAYQCFQRVIIIDAVSYPQAYFNMALLASQFNDFSLAIFNMKKYLILVPDAPDARAAQDKIYEWELKVGK